MSLKNRIRLSNSLAFRLTLWYAGIFTASSCVAFLLFYALISSFILDQTDRDLAAQVNRFALLLDSEGTGAIGDSAIIEAEAAGLRKVFFRFLTLDGQTFSKSNMSYWKDINIDTASINTLIREGQPVFQTISIPGREDKVRILYAAISPRIIMQVGIALEEHSRFLAAFQRVFIGTTSFLIVLAAGVGWFMARRAVSGIEAVTRTAQKISGGTLEERVPVKARGDEIDQLALTFNQMLDRIKSLLIEIKEMGDNMAHDLRSPIARIRGAAEITLTHGRNLGEYESMAANTIEECDRLLDMINTMLMISKTESGVGQISLKDVDLSAIVRKAWELFEPTAEDRNITMTCEVQEGIHVIGDTHMLQRTVSNLIDNAIKYTHSGGRVSLGLAVNRQEAIISVQDTGIGISDEDLPRIFERFYRCDQSRSESGIGLGLSLARAIARAHGGDISVESAPLQGSIFLVHLPYNSQSKA